MSPSRRAAWAAVALGALVAAVAVVLPQSLTREDQGKQAQYLLDAALNGEWLAPSDAVRGELATKPPLYTWLALAASRLIGLGETALRLPAGLAAVGLVAITLRLGTRLSGGACGVWAAVAVATTHHFGKMAGLARTDGLLACLIAAQILAVASAPDVRKLSLARTAGVAALSAAACLTKGPAGLVACLAIALWLVWTRRGVGVVRAAVVPALVGATALGGWFVAAQHARGDAVWTTMVDGELVRHASRGQPWNVAYYLPVLASRLLPWTLLVPVALVVARRDARTATVRIPPSDDIALPVSWLVASLAVFSLLPHKRPDLIYPAEPALCLLVGRLAGHAAPPSLRWMRATGWALAVACAAVGVAVAIRQIPGRLAVPAPLWLVAAGAAVFGAAAALAVADARRAQIPLAAAAIAGVALLAVELGGAAPQAASWSWRGFGVLVRDAADATGGRLLHTACAPNAACFHLRIARPAADDAALLAAARPFVVVAPARERRRLTELFGDVEVIGRHAGEPGSADVPLVALRVR